MHCCAFFRNFDTRRRGIAMLALFAFTLPALVLPASAASPDEVYTAIVADVIRPGFSALDAKTSAHAKDWEAMCAVGNDSTHSSVIASFHDMADAWAGVEMFRLGPASKDFRRDRFYLWPERKNAVSRAMTAALETPAETMTDTWVPQQSAAIQGLPVLERLLFDDGKPKDTPKTGSAECRLGLAVARNAAKIAHDFAAEWTARTGAPTAADRTALATDIVSGVGLIREEKFEAVIGKKEEMAKPRAAEFWRSGRSLRNLAINMETYEKLASIVDKALPESGTMTSAATATRQAIAGMHEPFADYAKGKARSDANFLLAALDSLGDSATSEVSAALGVTVGFNSSDGD